MRAHSPATARASSVFPVPGGPYSRIPLQQTRKGSSGSGLTMLSSTGLRLLELIRGLAFKSPLVVAPGNPCLQA